MRRGLIILAAAIFACAVMSVPCGAYTLYARGRAAAALDEQYSEKLSEINRWIEEESEQPAPPESPENEAPEKPAPAELYAERIAVAQAYRAEVGANGRALAEKLMDYDVALKNLRVWIARYESRRKKAASLELLFRTGECDEGALIAARGETDGLYLSIRSLMFEIGVMKSEIEKITGETLKDSFDFDSVYLIADVLAGDFPALEDRSRVGSICQPVGSELPEVEAPDSSAAFAAAVQAYYTLGEALREYLSAAARVKAGERDRRLGRISEQALMELTEAKEDTFLSAAKAKADFSKALLALDESVGGGLTFGYGISGEEIASLRGTLPEAGRGTGFWFTVRGGQGTIFCTAALPAGTFRSDERDTAVYRYTVRIGKKEIGSAFTGSPCVLSEIACEDGEKYAEITFTRNGVKAGVYRLELFAPYGGFIE